MKKVIKLNQEDIEFLEHLKNDINKLPSQTYHPFVWAVLQKVVKPAEWSNHDFWTAKSGDGCLTMTGTNATEDIEKLLDQIETTFGITKRGFVARDCGKTALTITDVEYKEELKEALENFDVADVAWFLETEFGIELNYKYWRYQKELVSGAEFVSLADAEKYVDAHPELEGADIVCSRAVPGSDTEKLIQLIAGLDIQEVEE